MHSIAAQLDSAFRAAIRGAFNLDADPIINASQNDKFGDYQSNAAMGLAKTLSKKPREVAEQIKASLQLGEIAEEVTIAGPGFINVRLSPKWLAAQLDAIRTDPRLGIDKVAAPQTVVVDYSGPSIAKEMHVGHLRSTIIGDAMARVLDFRGDKVIRQNHLGDWGTQFGRVVLGIWYEAALHRSGKTQTLRRLMERQESNQDLPTIARELGALHQQFINEDPDGHQYFLPYLRENSLNLPELERAYVFVSAVTDSPEAANIVITHPRHGSMKLADLPRLTTGFIQNPGDPANAQERLAWEKARDVTLAACNELYRRLNVQLADPTIQSEPMERGESFYNPYLADVVAELRAKGVAVESEGAIVVQVPGFESPLIIQKKSVNDKTGGYLYGTTDLAAIRFRIKNLGAQRIVYFVDARQGQHFTQVFWTAGVAGWANGVSLEHAAFGTMLGPDGKPFKTRSGGTVKLKDLLDEAEERAFAVVTSKNADLPEAQRREIARRVSIGAVKYSDLAKDRVSDYVFSFDKMLALDGNTAPYLQYAYARIRSIFRRARDMGISTEIGATAIRLESPHETALAKHVLRLGEVIPLVAREQKPHHLCTYLYELATRFSGFFENCPVLQSEESVRASRMALVDVTAKTLAMGLDLLGIDHPDQM